MFQYHTAIEDQNTQTPVGWHHGRGDGDRRGSISSEISEESVKPPSSQSRIFVSAALITSYISVLSYRQYYSLDRALITLFSRKKVLIWHLLFSWMCLCFCRLS